MSETLKHFFATVSVMLHQPMRSVGALEKSELVIGYYKNFGLTAASDQDARTVAMNAINDGVIDWADSELKTIDLDKFDPQIACCCKDKRRRGIWYMSGHSFFPEG